MEMTNNYKSITDDEYLSKKLIEDTIYEIDNNSIKIENNHTCYIRCNRVQNNFTKNEILDLYKKVYQLAKNQNVSIARKNQYKKYIDESWEEYEKELKRYNDLFDNLITICKEVKNRGLHYGTSDDIVLKKASNIKNEYEKVYHGLSINSNIKRIYRSLTELYNDLNNKEVRYTKIVL